MPTVAKLWPAGRPIPYFQYSEMGDFWEAILSPTHSGYVGDTIEEALLAYAIHSAEAEKCTTPLMADFGPVIEFLKEETK